MSRKLNLVLIFLLSFFSSCSHMQDGKFVQIGQPYELAVLLEIYGMSEENLRNHNPGKSLVDGEWIFIPRSSKSTIRFNGEGKVSPYALNADLHEITKDIEFVWPIKQNPISISSLFGDRGFSKHEGIDIPSHRGTKIYAAASGKVIFCKRMKGYGRTIIIDHGKGVHTIYAHNSKNLVRVGNRVTPKSVVALVGASGRATGNHLHFEIRIQGEAFDPLPFLERSKEVFMVKRLAETHSAAF